jgi:hypothetical protein
VALSLLPKPARIWASHRYRTWRERRDAFACDIMVLSRAKSGRTWLRAMLSRLYQQHYALDEAQLIEFDNFHRQNREIPKIYFTHGHYLHERFETPAWKREFGAKKLLFLVRNPCDVVVSEYFQSTRRAAQHKVELHGVDKQQSMFEFVMRGPVGLTTIIDYLNHWAPTVSSYDNALVVRYEDVRSQPVRLLSSIVDFLGAPFSKEEVEAAVEFAAFENLKELERKNFFKNSRLTPGDPSDPDSFKVRRGVVGGYRDYFDEGEIAEMEGLVEERLSPIYGYRASADTVSTETGANGPSLAP